MMMMPYSPKTGVPDGLWIGWEGIRDDSHSISSVFLNFQSCGQPDDTWANVTTSAQART